MGSGEKWGGGGNPKQGALVSSLLKSHPHTHEIPEALTMAPGAQQEPPSALCPSKATVTSGHDFTRCLLSDGNTLSNKSITYLRPMCRKRFFKTTLKKAFAIQRIGKLFATCVTNKGFRSGTYKEFLKSVIFLNDTLVGKKMGKRLEQALPKEEE